VEGQLVRCSCRPLVPGQLAVLLYRVLPDTNLHFTSASGGKLAEAIRTHMLAVLGPVAVYFLLMGFAWRADRACFYLALRPRWMRLWPRGKGLLGVALLRHNVCIYHSMLRVVFVAPCFTNYTHAQA
jgi:hypothetical protein